MREIKFRAWNKSQNIMCFDNEDNSADYWDGVHSSDLGLVNHNLKRDIYIYMQYTGLIDLYENDIVETSHHIYDGGLVRRNQVCFKDYCWKFVTLGIDRGSDIPIGLYANYPESFKKIGNIYENPELLK